VRDVLVQYAGDSLEFAGCEAVIPAQTDRAVGAIQIKRRVMLGADNMHVCRPMVVRINDYAQVPNSQVGRHRRRIAYS